MLVCVHSLIEELTVYLRLSQLQMSVVARWTNLGSIPGSHRQNALFSVLEPALVLSPEILTDQNLLTDPGLARKLGLADQTLSKGRCSADVETWNLTVDRAGQYPQGATQKYPSVPLAYRQTMLSNHVQKVRRTVNHGQQTSVSGWCTLTA